MTDEQFFTAHPDRYAHIRAPVIEMVTTKQRGVIARGECEREFMSLGDHKRERRRIILWRVPRDNPYYNPDKPQVLKIPFLAFSDESIEDRDDVLLPIVDEIMKGAARQQR